MNASDLNKRLRMICGLARGCGGGEEREGKEEEERETERDRDRVKRVNNTHTF